jgi:hypothetical protein
MASDTIDTPSKRQAVDHRLGVAGGSLHMTVEQHETGDAAVLRQLWLSVIIQAMRDAILREPSHYRLKTWRWCSIAGTSPVNIPAMRDRARQWLLENGRDFADVCGFAGLDPDAVRAAARRMLSSEKNIRAARLILFSEPTPTKQRTSAQVRHLLGSGQLFD